MSFNTSINHARRAPGSNTAAVVANADGTATITTLYEIGNLTGTVFTRYGDVMTHVMVVAASTAGPLIAGLSSAIAADSGLNLAGGDTVSLL